MSIEDIMKKKFVALLTLSLLVLLTACGPNTMAYLEKMNEAANWKASKETM